MDGHVRHLEIGQFVGDLFGEAQSVGRHAQQHFGSRVADAAQGFHDDIRIGERIAGTSDSAHRDAGFGGQGLVEIQHRFFGVEHAAGHSGTALVGAIGLARAVGALDVALGRHRQVDAPPFVLLAFAEAGVTLDGKPCCRDHDRSPSKFVSVCCQRKSRIYRYE